MATLLLLLLLWALLLLTGIGLALWAHLSPSPAAERLAGRIRELADGRIPIRRHDPQDPLRRPPGMTA